MIKSQNFFLIRAFVADQIPKFETNSLRFSAILINYSEELTVKFFE